MSEPDGAGSSAATQLLGLTAQDRAHLVADIGRRGFQPGCWLEVDPADLIVSAIDLLDVSERASLLDRLAPAVPPVEEFDGVHPWDPPAPGTKAWVVLTQTCDLVRDVRDEPLVQVVPIRFADSRADLANWWRNSSRFIPLDPTGTSSLGYVDLRVQAFLGKHHLLNHEVRHALPTDDDFAKQRPRIRFTLRVGQRFSRAGMPTNLVKALVEPLAETVGSGALAKGADRMFSEWLLSPTDVPRTFALLAVVTAAAGTPAFLAAEDLLYEQILPALPDAAMALLDEEGSRVVALEELRLVDWLAAFKLNFDHLTFGRKGDPASPEPQS